MSSDQTAATVTMEAVFPECVDKWMWGKRKR
jgi:hypothetical protein